MFRSTARAHKALLLAAGVAAISSASATSAQASQPTSYDFTCDLPLVGAAPFKVALTSTLPKKANVGVPVSSSTTAKLTSQDDGFGTDPGHILFKLVKATSVEGGATEDSNFALPGGGNLSVQTALTIPSTSVPAVAPLVLTASGALPTVVFPQAGTATLNVNAINLNLIARRADGSVIPLSQTQSYPDSDGDQDTFDAPCLPANGPITLATIKIKN